MASKNGELVSEFVDKKIIASLRDFVASDDARVCAEAINTVAKAFNYSGKSLAEENISDDKKLKTSFANNATLLIQKTWVEKTDAALKEQVLYVLEQIRTNARMSWKALYVPFLDLLYDAVTLMFGQDVYAEEFSEYAFRIDPEFGIFWWYISSLPHDAQWAEEKCRLAVLLGMYFIANY